MIEKYGYKKTDEFIQNNLNNPSNLVNSLKVDTTTTATTTATTTTNDNNNNNINYAVESFKNKYNLLKIKKINQLYKENNSDVRIVPQGINKYSKEYANYIVPKRQIGKSANIRLGGVY